MLLFINGFSVFISIQPHIPICDTCTTMADNYNIVEKRWKVIQVFLVTEFPILISCKAPFYAAVTPPNKTGSSIGIVLEVHELYTEFPDLIVMVGILGSDSNRTISYFLIYGFIRRVEHQIRIEICNIFQLIFVDEMKYDNRTTCPAIFCTCSFFF